MTVKTALFGAGQAGAMVMELLPPECEPVCFIDSDEKKCGTEYMGRPVVSLADAAAMKIDRIYICVLGWERTSEIETQLTAAGFETEIVRTCALADWDMRAAVIRLLAAEAERRGVDGSIAELGVYRGDMALVLNTAMPDRTLHLFDTFAGFTADDVAEEHRSGCSKAEAGDFSDTSAEAVLAHLPHAEKAVVHEGHFPETFAGCEGETFALVSLDADLYEPTAAALPLFWDRLSRGGAIIVHDYNSGRFAGVGAAVREFCDERKIFLVPLCDMHGSAVLMKQ
jgi:O-methyltransferase